MTPLFSLLHASYGRPEKAIAAMRMWLERATHPSAIEYIVAANDDDAATIEAFRRPDVACDIRWPTQVVTGPFAGSAPAWAAAAKASTGDLLVQVSDDYFPPENWSGLLLDRIIARAGLDWDTKAIVVRVGEHYRRDDLMTMAVCSRKYYQMQGEFLHAGYRSVFSDDEFSIRAASAARDGACILIDARDITFRHESPYHTGAEQDATLKRQNSAEAYATGVKLFVDRNSKLIAAGLKTW